MKRPTKIALTASVIVFIYFALVAHWVPTLIQSVLFYALVLVLFALNSLSWWRFGRINRDPDNERWRKRLGLAGLIANTLAIGLPIVAVLYGIYIDHRGPVRGEDILDFSFAVPVGMGLGLLSMIVGSFAPQRIRLTLVLSGLVIFYIIGAIPRAIF